MSASVFPVPLSGIQETLIAAKGDLIVGTANDTPGILTAGTTNQVLTVDSSTATGLKWATPATEALVFINRNSFTNVAGVNIDNVFSSTYKSYLISIENISAATATDALWFQFRYGSTTQTSSYWGNNALLDPNSATWAIQQMAPNNQLVISRYTSDSTNALAAQFYCNRVGNASERAYMSGISHQGTYFYTTIFGGTVNSAQTYTGFRLSSSSTNITGTVTTYGLATA